jgi:predicted ABC-type transport system involved in lysophospholipase L1 biosynthesis ATPase subunit
MGNARAMSAALLELNQVRCSVSDAMLLDNVSLCATATRTGLSGKTQGIAALLTGEARLVSGEFKVRGRPLEVARSQRVFGCALPPKAVSSKWTVRQVLELAAEVAGNSRRDSVLLARAATERMGKPLALKLLWSRCSPLEQALASLALGLIAEPEVLFVRLPFGELQAKDFAHYGAALERAVEGISLIAELTRPASLREEAEWVESLAEITYVFEAGGAGNCGPLPPNQVRHLLRVVGNSDRVAAALERAQLPAMALNAPLDRQLGRSAFLVDVHCDSSGVADTGPLLELCVELELVVLELLPVA